MKSNISINNARVYLVVGMGVGRGGCGRGGVGVGGGGFLLVDVRHHWGRPRRVSARHPAPTTVLMLLQNCGTPPLSPAATPLPAALPPRCGWLHPSAAQLPPAAWPCRAAGGREKEGRAFSSCCGRTFHFPPLGLAATACTGRLPRCCHATCTGSQQIGACPAQRSLARRAPRKAKHA